MKPAIAKLWQEYESACAEARKIWPQHDFEKDQPTPAFSAAQQRKTDILKQIDAHQEVRNVGNLVGVFSESVTEVGVVTYRNSRGIYPCRTLEGTTEDGTVIYASHLYKDSVKIF